MNDTKLKFVAILCLILSSVPGHFIVSSLMDANWNGYDTASLIAIIIIYLVLAYVAFIMKKNKSKR